MRTQALLRHASLAPSSTTNPVRLLLLFCAVAATSAFSASPAAAPSGDRGGGALYTRTWAVRLARGLQKGTVDRVAAEEGFVNLGKILELDTDDVYLFEHPRLTKRSLQPNGDSHARLIRRNEVIWAEQQIAKRRVKRDLLQFDDPLWPETWYLDRGARGGFDMNVKAAWSKGVTGRGVVLTVLDDGLEWQHPDLQANYDPDASIDLNNASRHGLDRDPMPRYDWTNENRHGTRCAGEIAAIANNGICSVGVAYNARIGGVRMLDGDVTDSVEAQSLSLNPQHIDVYSASWGPEDNGRTVDGPGPLARAAFLNGITKGRGGKGSLYVWASGNGGSQGDSCACDGYSNSPFTLSVSSVTQSNTRPWYLEECASTLATTYSSGANGGRDRQVVTTDLRHGCTELHTGTSASAPLAAAMVALALEANPRLTWRDMQYIVLMTANPRPLSDGMWITNGAGRQVSHLYGYGLMDAGAMVDLARNWTGVPDRKMWRSGNVSESMKISDGIKREITVPPCRPAGNTSCVRYLEHVQLVVSVESSRRGALRIVLHSPSGTASTVLPSRRDDGDIGDFSDWSFTSVHFWGEQPVGQWLVEVFNNGLPGATGVLESYELVLWGTSEDPLVQCHAECRRPCSGPGSNQCSDCVNYRIGTNGPCVARCPERSGYYTDALHRMCSPCPVDGCLACDSTRPTTCDVCEAGLLLDASHEQCIPHCPVGTWADPTGTQCIPCSQAHCMSCTNGSRCDSCADGYDWTPSAGACASVCAPDTYREAGPAARCLPCSERCETCTGPLSSQCSSCAPGLHLLEHACVAECPAETYASSDGQQCLPCHNSCMTCNGPLDNNCLSCANDSSTSVVLTLYNQCLLLEVCSAGQFRHANGSCMPCHPTCRACSGPFAMDCTLCSATSDGHRRYLGRLGCVEACDDGDYAGDDGACHPCRRPCILCSAGSGPGHCASCEDGWMLEEGSCTSNCSAGYHIASSKAACALCHPSCSLCFGPGSSDCITCPSSHFLEAGSCVTSCSLGSYLHQPIPGLYTDGSDDPAIPGNSSKKECLPCHHSCATCSGPGSNDCTSCEVALVLKKGQCIEKPACHLGQYYDDQQQECASCHKSCQSCVGSSSSECTACPPLHRPHPVGESSAVDDIDRLRSITILVCRPCCGRHGLPLVAVLHASSANSSMCCPCASDATAIVGAYVDSSTDDPDCTPETTSASTVPWTTTGLTSSGVSHVESLLRGSTAPSTEAAATSTFAASSTSAAASTTSDDAGSMPATSHTPSSSLLSIAMAGRSTLPATGISTSDDGRSTSLSTTADARAVASITNSVTDGKVVVIGGTTSVAHSMVVLATGTISEDDGKIALAGSALFMTTSSITPTAETESDSSTSPAAAPGDGKDVLQLEREMSLLTTLAAVVGAVTLTCCAVYGAAVVVLYARHQGMCTALVGARCTNGGVIYVQVDTNGDGDTVTTSASTAIRVDKGNDFDGDTCDEDDYDSFINGRQSMPGLDTKDVLADVGFGSRDEQYSTCASAASLTALGSEGYRGVCQASSPLVTQLQTSASSGCSLIDMAASSSLAYENCQCDSVAVAADVATPATDVTSVAMPAVVAAAAAAAGPASGVSRALVEIKDL